MAAGLGFKTFTTGEVLTAADTNGYLMQGVNVFASAAARDAAITSPQEGQFAYLKDTNVTTYYTGSAWANLDTTGMTNPMTTTGDTIYSSSGSTPARLGIGSTGQVLTVASGVPSWATPASGGGMTSIATGSLSGTTTTISSISGSYIHLYLVILSPYLNTSGNPLKITWNGITSGTYAYVRASDSSGTWTSGTAQTGLTITGTNMETYSIARCYSMMIQNYTTSTYHRAIGNMTDDNTSGGGTMFGQNSAITSAITSIGITTNAGTSTFAGGTYTLYGVK
jgi:hypothetical protein